MQTNHGKCEVLCTTCCKHVRILIWYALLDLLAWIFLKCAPHKMYLLVPFVGLFGLQSVTLFPGLPPLRSVLSLWWLSFWRSDPWKKHTSKRLDRWGHCCHHLFIRVGNCRSSSCKHSVPFFFCILESTLQLESKVKRAWIFGRTKDVTRCRANPWDDYLQGAVNVIQCLRLIMVV